VLSPAERALEFFLNGLRLIDGVARASYPSRTGNCLDLISNDLSQLVSDGLLSDKDGQIACTALGIRHLNSVLARLEQALASHS
ncbi:MAG: hypothetical protein ACPG43_06895, partial [Alcanivoracaceae bacterium]